MQMRNFWHEKLLCDTVLVSADGTEFLEARIGSDFFLLVVMMKNICKNICTKLAVSHMANGRCMKFNLSDEFRNMRFPVHRLILASGSEQLGALLNGHFSEGDQAGTRETKKMSILDEISIL